jgi:hypothetical protein
MTYNRNSTGMLAILDERSRTRLVSRADLFGISPEELDEMKYGRKAGGRNAAENKRLEQVFELVGMLLDYKALIKNAKHRESLEDIMDIWLGIAPDKKPVSLISAERDFLRNVSIETATLFQDLRTETMSLAADCRQTKDKFSIH